MATGGKKIVIIILKLRNVMGNSPREINEKSKAIK